VHDFQPGILPSGLFWTTQIDDDDLRVDHEVATVRVKNARVTDNGAFLGPGTTPGAASFEISWTPTGEPRILSPHGREANDPSIITDDAHEFSAVFRDARVKGSFTVTSGGITYTGSWQGTPGAGVDFAEIGVERNGVFALPRHHH
jgi:hypothetical protein